MIGVIAKTEEHDAVREFFELFKTPWEFYRNERRYEVLLCTSESQFDMNSAKLVLIYLGATSPFDFKGKAQVASRETKNCDLAYKGARLPVYEGRVTFQGEGSAAVCDQKSRRSAMYVRQYDDTTVVRVGYDLFAEVRMLLTTGQPTANASIPTLELHISLLRDLIVASGVEFVELPPIPKGYKFIACLTHDVDHPLFRRHWFDHTMFGFLYRATLGSLIDLFRGKRSVRAMARNWQAALKLPLVYLGLARDFWAGFDRYARLEKGFRSSFYVIPFKNRPGRNGRRSAPSRRAARYGAADVETQIRSLLSAGCEVGAHGIDAWCDSAAGRAELEQVGRITGSQNIGVRMHWLYFNEESPVALENAGAAYDSSVGYNEAIGYRAGTTQVFKPFGATRLLELPLHIMDTALFYPTRLGLTPEEADRRVREIIENAVQFGGCVTINWHDRSIAPERCWDEFYVDLVNELGKNGAWFATAAEVVSWFRKRRFATFENDEPAFDRPSVKSDSRGEKLPDLLYSVHNPGQTQAVLGS